MDTASVPTLVTQLCEAMVRQQRTPGHIPSSEQKSTLVRMLRAQSFGILLHKTLASCHTDESLDEMDAPSRLVARSFVLNLRQQHKLANRMEECVEHLLSNNLHCNPTIEAVLQILVLLVDEGPKQREEHCIFHYTRPEVHDGLGPLPYPDFHPSMFEPPAWMLDLTIPPPSNTDLVLPLNDSFPFNKEPGTDLPLLGRFIQPSHKDSRNGCMPYDIPVLLEITEPRNINVPKLNSSPDQGDEGYGTPSSDNSPVGWRAYSVPRAKSVWDLVLSSHLPRHRTWESLGQLKPVPEVPFLGEAEVRTVHELFKVKQSKLLAPPLDLIVVDQQDLVRQIKYLLVGIMSNSFLYQQNTDSFVLRPGICVEGVTPSALQGYTCDFLVCGTFYRRLRALAVPEPLTGRLAFQGLIFQALCQSVRRYLQFYYGAVLLLPDGPLLNLHRRVQGLKHQLMGLARLCKVDGTGRLPEGIALVTFLYRQIGIETRRDMSCILYSALHACSQVYFRFLQKWIFEGVSQDVYEEFFIQMKPAHASVRSRVYWNCRFVLVEQAVPGFLCGLANDVFQCGKAVNLLKLCNPSDPLCVTLEGGYPSMPCCLRRSDLLRLTRECSMFERRARALCGEPVTTARIYRHSEAQQRAFEETVRQAQEQRLLTLKLEREATLQQQAQQKQQQLAVLRKQMQFVVSRREEERERQLREDASLEQENKHLEEEETKRREDEKQKLLQYYAELSEAADQRRHRAEWRTERLKLHDKRIELLAAERSAVEVTINLCNAENRPTTVLECIEEVALDASESLVQVSSNTENIRDDLETQTATKTIDTVTCNMNINGNHTNCNINKNICLVALQHLSSNKDMRNYNHTLEDTMYDSRNPLDSLNNINKDNVIVLECVDDSKHMDIIKPAQMALDNSAPDLQISTQKVKDNVQVGELEICTANQVDESDVNKNRWRMLHGDINILTGESRQAALEQTSLEEMSRDTSRGPSKTSSEYNLSSLTASSSFDLGKTGGSSNLASLTSSNSFDLIKGNNCYNQTSLTTSSSFDLSSGKFSISTDTPDVVFPASVSQEFVNSPETEVGEGNLESRESSIEEEGDDGDPEGEGELSILLRKSVAIPLYTQARLVNEAVLKLFLVDQNLLEHLASLRGFFFLLDGEFGRSITGSLFQGLSQVQHPSQLLNAGTLNAILAKALTSSLGGGGPHGERLSFSVRTMPERLKPSSPDVLKCLCLQYRVEWPLNVVLTPDALRKYDEVFGFLLEVRRMSWVLEDDFHHLKRIAGGAHTWGQQFHHVQLWRHEMTLFVRAVQNYLTSTVLQASWVEFQRELQRASTLDDLYRTHVSYVKRVLFRCLIIKQSEPMQKVLLKVFSMILKFHGQLRAHTWCRSDDGRELKHPHFDNLAKMFESYQALVRFLYQFALKLAIVGYQPHLFELLEILNVNGYYQKA